MELHLPVPARKGRQFICNQRTIRKNGEPHPILYHSADEIFEIFANERFTALETYVHDRALPEFLEKLEPYFRGEIVLHITSTGKMATVRAT